MAIDLLETQLRIPPEPHHHLLRTQLVNALERGVPQHTLTTVLAPAGYGKTTLVAQWARTTHLPVAWVSISDDVNDVERFLRYLVTAWGAIRPEILDNDIHLRLRAIMPDIDAVLAAFVNSASSVPDHTVFVLDDVHLLEDEAIHHALTFLFDHLPSNLHFVLAGRGAPPLPLPRYRARGTLLELGASDLGFAIDESKTFLNDLMGLDVDDENLATLHTQLEGWAAGLHLTALTLREPGETGRSPVISGRHRFIADYLQQDVLARLPGKVRQFLLQTSILDRLSGPLCDAVTGRDDSQVMLELLERDNLFIVPLDEQREWYRYHRLFSDALHQTLLREGADDLPGLHQRAARWHLDARLPEPAFQHAVAANDDETGFEIFDRYANVLLNTGQRRLLQQWLDEIPPRWRERYPVFGLSEAGLLIFSGAFEAGLRRIEEIEQRLTASSADDAPAQLGRVTAIRCFIACMQNDLPQAEMLADRAMRELPDEDLGFRPGIFTALGDTYRRNGFWRKAKDSYLTALGFTHAPMVRMHAAHIFGALADLELRQGRLHTAANHWEHAREVVQAREHWGHLPLPLFGWIELRLGEILYEWNRLEDARAHLERGVERAGFGGDVQAVVAGSVIFSRLKLTDGDIAGAEALLEQARPLVEAAALPDWTGRFERAQVDLWLARNERRTAAAWAEAKLTEDAREARPESEPTRLALARVMILKGDEPSLDRAATVLDRLIEASVATDRKGVQIEALAMQALVQQQRGAPSGAMTSLEHALRLAEPEGYVRLFADLGLPMARLLQEARSRGVMPQYVVTLLEAFGIAPGPTGRRETLPEPLSAREREVLQRIAAGLTNREIADLLFISAETVKKHTGNIYGKLGVRGRTEAVARGRTLDLLD
jgi:LuxR family maltose regulon positive regulatory protein